jgi:hypothetical protein
MPAKYTTKALELDIAMMGGDGRIAASVRLGSGSHGAKWEFSNASNTVAREFRIAGCFKGKFIFWFWLSSRFVEPGVITLRKVEVDKANKGKKFKEDFEVTLSIV